MLLSNNERIQLNISHLFTYPIKSCRPTFLTNSIVTPHGLDFDRQFMLVGSDGTFISQRTHPHLATVEVKIHTDGLLVAGTPETDNRPTFVRFPFRKDGTIPVSVHKMPFMAFDQGDEHAAWFSKRIGSPCRLVAVDETQMRRRDHAGTPFTITCHDSSPIHLITSISLNALNLALIEKGVVEFGIDNFRPNLVVSCAPYAFAEDGWSELTIGEVVLQMRKKTSRCIIINVNQVMGVRSDGEPLRTLSEMRRTSEGVMFGIYLMVTKGGEIHLDQEVRVTK